MDKGCKNIEKGWPSAIKRLCMALLSPSRGGVRHVLFDVHHDGELRIASHITLCQQRSLGSLKGRSGHDNAGLVWCVSHQGGCISVCLGSARVVARRFILGFRKTQQATPVNRNTRQTAQPTRMTAMTAIGLLLFWDGVEVIVVVDMTLEYGMSPSDGTTDVFGSVQELGKVFTESEISSKKTM